MYFAKHSEISEDKHAFLSPSNYHWLNYDEEKLKKVYLSQLAREKGTELHALARKCIELGVRLPDTQETLNMYVNDAIDLELTPEQPLYYSPFCYGTADAIGIVGDVLHIHDLKSGTIKASTKQLLVYAALFFLEYNIRPEEFSPYTTPTELRIYQSGYIIVDHPTPDTIFHTMEIIVAHDEVLHRLRGEGSLWKSVY